MKRTLTVLGTLLLVIAICTGIYMIMYGPVRCYRGEIIRIENVDDHKVLVVKENDETEHWVHITILTTFTEGDSDEISYAYFNVRQGDYIEGTYHNEFPYKKEFAKEMVRIKK